MVRHRALSLIITAPNTSASSPEYRLRTAFNVSIYHMLRPQIRSFRIVSAENYKRGRCAINPAHPTDSLPISSTMYVVIKNDHLLSRYSKV